MKWIKWLFQQEQEFSTKYDETKIHRILKNPKLEKDHNIDIWRDKKRLYFIHANWYAGTGRVNGISSSPISVKLKVLNSNDQQTNLRIWTDSRWELIGITCMGIPLSIIVSIANANLLFLTYGLLGTTAIFFWFRMVYRVQESNIVEKLKKVLRLRRII